MLCPSGQMDPQQVDNPASAHLSVDNNLQSLRWSHNLERGPNGLQRSVHFIMSASILKANHSIISNREISYAAAGNKLYLTVQFLGSVSIEKMTIRHKNIPVHSNLYLQQPLPQYFTSP